MAPVGGILPPFYALFGKTLSNSPHLLMQSLKRLISPAMVSFRLALMATVLMGIWALSSSLYPYITRKKSRTPLLFLLGFVMPSIVLGIAFIRFYSQEPWTNLYPSLALVALAVAAKYVFIIYEIIHVQLIQVPRTYWEAARLYPIATGQIVRRILLPILTPTLAAALLAGILLSFGETTLTLLLYPPGNQPVTAAVFTLTSNASHLEFSAFQAAALIIHLLIITASVAGLSLIFKRHEKRYFLPTS